MASHDASERTEIARRAGRVERGESPRRSKGRGGLRLRKLREGLLIDQKDVAEGLARLYDDGHPFSSSLLSEIELEHCRLPRGFRADYRQVLEALG